ncbi:SMP-30/gluconolactonase/LRE family protein [Erythrobacter fulvus]|uniref:SMP-30/gluconolactonase/LRE family protein n=1 Tax=Erythrobacter fulvus TaxID=2987523 RepID=UPI0023599843|nr:SMP-30/gluconolactonase/LRE family protein [Erythrobacter fulvus]
MSASLTGGAAALPVKRERMQCEGFYRRLDTGRRWRLAGGVIAVLAALSSLPAGATTDETGPPPLVQVERFPADGGLTHAEDGVVLPDGRLLVGDWKHGLVTIAPDGTIAPFGDFAAAGFRTKPDPLWNSPNGIAWEPDGRHVLVADITGGHIYRVDTVTQSVARIYDHPFGVNAAIRDSSGAIWFTQSTRNAPGAGSESRMFAAADRPMGDGSVWRIAPDEVGKPVPRAVKLVDRLDFANGIALDAQRGRLYVAEIVASRVLSFAVDSASGTLGDRRVLARVTTPDNLELAADGMLWAASPFANAIYRIDPDSGAVGTVFNPDPAKSARMVAELERRQAAGEPLLPLLSPELWAPMPGLVTGVILPSGTGPAYVSGLGDALVQLEGAPGLDNADVEAARRDIQRTIDTVYAAISGPAGSSRDWNAFRSMFSEGARLFTITREGMRGGGVEDYIALSDKALVSYGFREEELINRIDVYGKLAQAWSSYEGHFVRDGEPGRVRGINGFQLQQHADVRWRVHSLLWQQENAEFPLPDSMAGNRRQLDASASVEAPKADREIEEVLEHRTRVILEGIRSDDVSGIMALYAPGALYAADSSTLLSKPEAIEAFWVEVAASDAQDATLDVLRIEQLAPDAFVEIQKYAVFNASGERLFGGYASLLWRKIGGRWLIAADVSN